MSDIDKKILIQRQTRCDAARYFESLGERQRGVNENVLAFADRKIPDSAKVLDICCGPQGSSLASQNRGYYWVGLDAAPWFAHQMPVEHSNANVVISDMEHTPFSNNTFDAALMVFALNNASNPSSVLAEAARVTKPGGHVISAEPGPSLGTVRNVLYSVLRGNLMTERLFFRKPYQYDVPNYFKDKPFEADDFAENFIENSLGMESRTHLKRSAQDLASEKLHPKKFEYRLYQMILERYFDNVLNLAANNGLILENAGIGCTALAEQNRWLVTPIVDIPTDKWQEELKLARKWRGAVTMGIPVDMTTAIAKSPQRIIFPAFSFRKEEAIT
jgi:ubiquinone/menaquinone biosynthesis C-methylase UbiE